MLVLFNGVKPLVQSYRELLLRSFIGVPISQAPQDTVSKFPPLSAPFTRAQGPQKTESRKAEAGNSKLVGHLLDPAV